MLKTNFSSSNSALPQTIPMKNLTHDPGALCFSAFCSEVAASADTPPPKHFRNISSDSFSRDNPNHVLIHYPSDKSESIRLFL